MKIEANIVANIDELKKLGIDLRTLEEDLTLPNPEYANAVRFSRFKGARKPDKYICYLKKDKYNNYIIPKYYLGEPEMECGFNGRELSSHSFIKLRGYQDSFLNENKETLDTNTGILMEAPCGHGKTIMGIWLSYYRGRQTLIVVPTYYLATQWEQRIKETTDASVVILRSSDTEIATDSDFTIVVTELFQCRILPNDLIKNVGHVILDEAHRMGAETYMPILDELPAHYRTALTATFRRTDGVHKILKYHFGKHIKMPNRFPHPKVYSLVTDCHVKGIVSKSRPYSLFLDFMERRYTDKFYKLQETNGAIVYDSSKNNKLHEIAEEEYKSGVIDKKAFKEIERCLSNGSMLSYPTLLSFLNENSARRKTCVKLIEKCLNVGRTILFLSARKDTLRSLCSYFSDYGPRLIVSETNSRTDEENEYLQNKCRLIFGINQLAKEGLDIDRLDTLIIHLPMADTEQAIGRISRLCTGKKTPTAFYLLDDCPITYATFVKAKKTIKINADYIGDIHLGEVDDVVGE